MNNIKMSDVFSLPVGSMHIIDYKVDVDATIAASVAINAYDDNQTRIEELNEHRIGQNRCIKQQREEINELKAIIADGKKWAERTLSANDYPEMHYCGSTPDWFVGLAAFVCGIKPKG